MVIQNERQIVEDYNELNCNTRLKKVKEQHEALVQQREKEKEEKIRAKKLYCKALDDKKKKQKMQVYMGDSAKVNNDPKVLQLKKKLDELRN